MSGWRQKLKSVFPVVLRDAISDLRVLPREARAAWWMALRHHRQLQLERLIPTRDAAPYEIVTVCYGNIYRSPFAAAALVREIERRQLGGVRVTSAGLVKREGRVSPEDAQAVAQRLGISLNAHRSQRITREQIERARLLIVMDRQHEALLLKDFPDALPKIVPLWHFPRQGASDRSPIQDPYGHGSAAVERCYSRILEAVQDLSELMDARAPGTAQQAAPLRRT